jgi:CubicO group peptidase (beta-lactamase class C family)
MKNKFILTVLGILIVLQNIYCGIPNDSSLVESFFDGLITDHLKTKNIAGATVAVVKDGKLFFSKGYGFSDLEKQIPVDPQKTLFRVGSISKLFVWTAVMQLVEQKKLDLDADINQYLKDFKIPPTFDKPITLRHLMTHTPGFEDRVIGLFGKDEKSLKPLGEILARELPARVSPAGEISSYSNHGTGIAAYIVEQLSGMPFKDYVNRNIILPLRMEHFTFDQPLPDELKEDMSKGYRFTGGDFKEEGFEYVPLYPVGAASSSATGISNFMIAHLQNGRFGDVRILDSITAVEMHSTQFRPSPDLNGFCLGFMEFDRNGERVIAHGGDTFWFHSAMALLPDEKTGIFISLNTAGGSPSDLALAFIDHFFPGDKKNGSDTLLITMDDAGQFKGYFRSARYPHHDLTRLIGIMNPCKVTFEGGCLVTNANGEKTSWLKSGELSFFEKGGKDKLEFRKDEKGKIKFMFVNSMPYSAFEKIPASESPVLQLGLLILVILIFLFTIMYWPLAWLIRKKYLRDRVDESVLPFNLKCWVWISCAILVSYPACLMIILSDPVGIVFGIPWSLKIVQALPVVNLLIAGMVIYLNIGLWRSSKYPMISKLHYSVVALSLVIFEMQLFQWNLLGWNY